MAPKRNASAAGTTDGTPAGTTTKESSRRSTRTSTGGANETQGGDASAAVNTQKEQGQGEATSSKATNGEGMSKEEQQEEVKQGQEDKEGQAPAAKKAKTDEPSTTTATTTGTPSKGGVYKVGDTVEDISLIDENGETVSIKELYEKNGLVIFSYPKANTPGCTNQACGYRDFFSEFDGLGWKVFGLSTDKPNAQMSWKTSKNFQYSLLSDPEKKFLKRLGATEAKKRCHWIIEKGGRLIDQDIGVKPASDPTNALNIVKALSCGPKKPKTAK